MNRDIISRKRKYEPLDLSWDDRLDQILERRWSFGTCVGVGAAGIVAVGAMIFVGNIVLGLN
jgi:hypothetical protein